MSRKEDQVGLLAEDPEDVKLEFQDIAVTSSEDKTKFTDFPPYEDSAANEEKAKAAGFWSLQYYQQFFAVDQRQVSRRLLFSLFPQPRRNFLEFELRPTPDLYGPIWVTITLIFSIAIFGNLSTYFSRASDLPTGHYTSDFHRVPIAAVTLVAYWTLVSLCLMLLKWFGGTTLDLTVLEISSLIGYSFTAFIPAAVICAFPVPWLQWMVLLTAAVASGTVLVLTLQPALAPHKAAPVVLGLLFLAHIALAVVLALNSYTGYEGIDFAATTTHVLITTTTAVKVPLNSTI